MRQLIWVGLMMVVLTACTNLKFDGYDPSTAMVRWIIRVIKNDRFIFYRYCFILLDYIESMILKF